jgi:hypothetical protein
MTAEWMITVHDCRGETQEAINNSSYGEACEVIGNVAQRKLLEYLIATHVIQFVDIDGHNVKAMLSFHLESMLKQLEAK